MASLEDAVSSPEFHERLQSAEAEYGTALLRWRKHIVKIRQDRSSVILRWRLADDILRFEEHLRSEWGIQPTNTLRAIALDLGVSKSALGYMFRLRERLSLAQVKALRISWSKVQEILDIEDYHQMNRCLEMAREDTLKSQEDIRRFKKQANSRRL